MTDYESVGLGFESLPGHHIKGLSHFVAVFFSLISGFLSSQGASPQVLSAFAGLTAVFGKRGGTTASAFLWFVIRGPWD